MMIETVATLFALLLVAPVFLAAAFVALVSLGFGRCPVSESARAEAEWAAMLAEETAAQDVAAWSAAMESLAAEETAAQDVAAWSVTTVDAAIALAVVHAASVRALSRSSARIDDEARKARFARAARGLVARSWACAA